MNRAAQPMVVKNYDVSRVSGDEPERLQKCYEMI